MEKSLARKADRPGGRTRHRLVCAIVAGITLAATMDHAAVANESAGSVVREGRGGSRNNEQRLTFARDLAAEAAQAAAQGQVFVVLYGTAGCPWCTKVRRSYLIPLQRNPEFSATAVVREIDPERQDALTDFAGQTTTHAAFAKQHGIRFVPVVAFLAPDGQPLAAPIIGMSSEDFYGAYLDERLAEARAKLAVRRAPGTERGQ